MKNLISLILISLFIASCNVSTENNCVQPTITDSLNATNNFYDNTKIYNLPLKQISIEGEIDNPGFVDFSKLPIRIVAVKETLLSEEGKKFEGAYRYDGYSLHDILNQVIINKKNKGEFRPIVDLYIQIENDKGEKVNISWGEIYYTNHLHEIIIASKVMRIVPTKINKLWPLPTTSKLIVTSDLITERNISNPVKITVKSYPKSFVTIKGLKPLYSPKIDIYSKNKLVETLTENPKNLQTEKFNTIFYGQGRGVHSTKPITGVLLKNILAKNVDCNQKNIREGIFVIVAKDGYRGVYTYSEIMNRNDQSEVLLVCEPESNHNGIFKIFPTSDFFGDRSIKGIDRIYFSAKEQ